MCVKIANACTSGGQAGRRDWPGRAGLPEKSLEGVLEAFWGASLEVLEGVWEALGSVLESPDGVSEAML